MSPKTREIVYHSMIIIDMEQHSLEVKAYSNDNFEPHDYNQI